MKRNPMIVSIAPERHAVLDSRGRTAGEFTSHEAAKRWFDRNYRGLKLGRVTIYG